MRHEAVTTEKEVASASVCFHQKFSWEGPGGGEQGPQMKNLASEDLRTQGKPLRGCFVSKVTVKHLEPLLVGRKGYMGRMHVRMCIDITTMFPEHHAYGLCSPPSYREDPRGRVCLGGPWAPNSWGRIHHGFIAIPARNQTTPSLGQTHGGEGRERASDLFHCQLQGGMTPLLGASISTWVADHDQVLLSVATCDLVRVLPRECGGEASSDHKVPRSCGSSREGGSRQCWPKELSRKGTDATGHVGERRCWWNSLCPPGPGQCFTKSTREPTSLCLLLCWHPPPTLQVSMNRPSA